MALAPSHRQSIVGWLEVYGWRFSLVEAGCGAQIRRTRQRITVHGLCPGDYVGSRSCRSRDAVPIILRRTTAARRSQKRRADGRAPAARARAVSAPVTASPRGEV